MSTKDTYAPFPAAALESEVMVISPVSLEPRFRVVLQSESCRRAACAEASAAWNRRHLANLAAGMAEGNVCDFPGADRYDPEVFEAHEEDFFWAYVGFHYKREDARLEALVAAQPAGTFECGHGQDEDDEFEDDDHHELTFEEDYICTYWPCWDEEWLKHLDDLEAEVTR